MPISQEPLQTITSGANNAGTVASTTGVPAANNTAIIPSTATNASAANPNTAQVGINYGMTGPTAANNVATATNAPTATSDQYQQAISRQLGQLQQPVDANNNVVKAQTTAFNNQAQQGLDANENADAEAAYASGNVQGGGLGATQQQAREAAAASEGQNLSGAITAQTAAQQAERDNLIATGGNLAGQQQNTTNQANQATANEGIQQQQITNQAGQFNSQLGLNEQQLAQQQNDFGVQSQQNQQQISNALEQARAQTALGYYGQNNQYNLGEDQLTAGATAPAATSA
jgi:hypothetical protein